MDKPTLADWYWARRIIRHPPACPPQPGPYPKLCNPDEVVLVTFAVSGRAIIRGCNTDRHTTLDDFEWLEPTKPPAGDFVLDPAQQIKEATP